MIRFVLRVIGVLLLAAAFAALIVDATRSIVGERILFFSFGETARWLAPAALTAAEEAAGHHGLGPALTALAELPTWLVAGIAGGLCGALGRWSRGKLGGSEAGRR